MPVTPGVTMTRRRHRGPHASVAAPDTTLVAAATGAVVPAAAGGPASAEGDGDAQRDHQKQGADPQHPAAGVHGRPGQVGQPAEEQEQGGQADQPARDAQEDRPGQQASRDQWEEPPRLPGQRDEEHRAAPLDRGAQRPGGRSLRGTAATCGTGGAAYGAAGRFRRRTAGAPLPRSPPSPRATRPAHDGHPARAGRGGLTRASVPGVLVVTRFDVPEEQAASFLPQAEAALRAFAARPGYLRGRVGRAADDPTAWVLTTEWDGVGSYRRSLSAYDVKVDAAPLLARGRDEPSAFEVLLSDEGTAPSARAADADRTAVGRSSGPAVSDLR